MLSTPTHWIWDSWYVKDGDTYHAYFLQAPKSLGNPDLRHINARVGHATSLDLYTWNYLGECFSPSQNDFDSTAIWTGSIVKADDVFHYFYTGLQFSNGAHIQKVGHALSTDLHNFFARSSSPIVQANPDRYVTTAERDDEPFRDPWVFSFNGRWHMFVTASQSGDATMNQGVVAHAISDDLLTWEDQGPIISNVGMGQIEVTQVVEVEGQWFLIFCNHPAAMAAPPPGCVAGTYCVPAQSPLGPFDFSELSLISHHYAGRVITDPAGNPVLLGFLDKDADGQFIGAIDDPIPLHVSAGPALAPQSTTHRQSEAKPKKDK